MPAKQVAARGAGAGAEKSFFSTAYEELTSSENTTIVRSILVFGVCPSRLFSRGWCLV